MNEHRHIPLTRPVILLWRGYSWQHHIIEVPSGLETDLPKQIEHQPRGETAPYRFDLVGTLMGTPYYTQQERH